MFVPVIPTDSPTAASIVLKCALLPLVATTESAFDAVRIATLAEFVESEVMPTPMSTGRDEILAGLNNHHYYFQDAINRVALTHGVGAQELGRRVGLARPRRVDPELVATLANEMKEAND